MNMRNRFVDLYAELGLTQHATTEEIRAAYKNLIKETHPDKFPHLSARERERLERRAQRLNEAKNILLDEQKRRQYDELYKQHLAEAVAFATKAGYDGTTYNEYASRMEGIQAWNENVGTTSRARPLIFVLLFVMAVISLFWRFVNPEEFGKASPPPETPTLTLADEVYRTDAVTQSIALLEQAKTLTAVASYRGIVGWSLNRPQDATLLYADSTAVSLAAFGNRLALGTMNGLLHLFEFKDHSLKLTRTIVAHQSVVTCINFSHDGKMLVTSSWDKTAKIWNTETGELVRTRMGIAFPIYAAVFTSDDRHIAFTNDQQVMIWNWRDGQLKNIGLHRRRLLTMSTHGDWVLSAGEDRTVKLTHITTGSVRATESEPMTTTCVAFSPKGNIFATANADGFVRIYATQSCRKLEVIAAHASQSGKGKATSVRFSDDGRILYSAGADSSLKAWDMAQYLDLPS
jgi:WD40 repeat protein